MREQVNLRFVVVNGSSYVRLEDIVRYLNELAATEETDVRKRFEEAANNLLVGAPGVPK